MNAQGWRAVLLHAFAQEINDFDPSAINGLAQQLAEEDESKQLLHDAGFGVTGTSLLVSVRNALVWIAAHEPEEGSQST